MDDEIIVSMGLQIEEEFWPPVEKLVPISDELVKWMRREIKRQRYDRYHLTTA